jgi:hypothetical protein
MDTTYHLTTEGWQDEPLPEQHPVETWRVQSERFGAGNIVRWTRIWHSDAMSFEDRRLLFRKFAAPPLPDHREQNLGVAAEVQT